MRAVEFHPDSQQRLTRWFANVGLGYADVLTNGIIFLILTPVFVRSLGVDGYAVWLIAHTIAFYLGYFDIGFGHAQVRFHARWAAGRFARALQGLLATTTCGLFAAGVAAAITGLGFAWLGSMNWVDAPPQLRGELREVLVLLSINLLMTFPSSVLSNLYRGAQRIDLANARSIVVRLITAAAQLTCLFQGRGLIALATIELAMTAMRICIDLAILSRLLPNVPHIPVRFHRRTWRGIRRYALWSAIEDLLVGGATHIEQLLIVALLPFTLLTPYALCGAAAGVLYLAIGPITETFLPLAAQLHAERKNLQLAQLLTAGTKATVGIAAPAAVFLWIYGTPLLKYWSAEGTADMPPGLLQIVILNFLVSAFLTTSALMLLATGRVKTIALLTFAEVALSVVLVFWAVPRHGLNGVAIGLLTANLLVGFAAQVPISLAIFRVRAAEFWWTSLGRILLAAAPAYAAAYGLRASIPPNLAGFAAAAVMTGLVYLAALVLLGSSSRERAGYAKLWRERNP